MRSYHHRAYVIEKWFVVDRLQFPKQIWAICRFHRGSVGQAESVHGDLRLPQSLSSSFCFIQVCTRTQEHHLVISLFKKGSVLAALFSSPLLLLLKLYCFSQSCQDPSYRLLSELRFLSGVFPSLVELVRLHLCEAS